MPMTRSAPRLVRLYTLSLTLALAAASSLTAGTPTELFFSEYVEGSSSNKAIEIYNGTGVAVNLATGSYVLEIYFNGSGTPGTTVTLSGTVADGDVHIVADDDAGVAILTVADQTSTSGFFNGNDAVVLRKGGVVIDALGRVGEDPGTAWTGGGLSTRDRTLRRQAAICAGDTNASDAFDPALQWQGFAQDTFDGLGAHTVSCGVGPSTVEIFELQGSGVASPFAGQQVTTEDNVVTAVGPEGFAIQTPAARDDADPDTSNGVYVFTGTPPTVSVGDLVDVTGTVQEFFELTEITGSPVVTVVGTGSLPAPLQLNAATPSPDPTTPSCALEYECYEGMRVEIVSGSVSGPSQSFGPDPTAEIHIVARPGRAYRETGVAHPGLMSPPIPTWDGNPEVFELDPDALGLANRAISAGSTFSAVGVIGFEFSDYELWPTSLTVMPAAQPLAAQPVRPRAPGELTIGTLNVFRLFDDIDDPGNDTVVDTAEYARRRAKFVRYILEVLDAPEVLGIQEVEKLGVLQQLATDIQTADGTVVYTAYLVEGNDVGGIDVGYLVRDAVTVSAVTQLGAGETLSVDGSPLHDRPPLLLEGTYTGSGANLPLAVMVNHTRSLGGIDDSTDGPRVRQKRLEQAQSIAQKVQDFQSTSPAVPLLVIGDLNAFEFTDGYVDLVGQIQGDFDPAMNLLSGPDLVSPDLTNEVLRVPVATRYSFIFAGSAQVLDHVLTSQAAAALVTDAAFGHGNADSPRLLIEDDSTPLRASDHDGFVVYLAAGPLFADGFESGDTGAWSVVVP